MKHRTAIITAASIAVVIAAATAAIATNLGILDGATESANVGALTIASAQTATTSDAPSSGVVLVEDDTAVPASGSDAALTSYAVGDAGVVTLSNDGTTITVVDMTTSPGWDAAQTADGAIIEVSFSGPNGESLAFLAQLDPTTGAIATAVNDLAEAPVVVVTENVYEDGTPATASEGSYEDGDDDDDRYENDDNKSDDSRDDDRYENEEDDDD